MEAAARQLGQTEKYPGDNLKVLEYHATTGRFKNDEVPWCSSFVNWSFNEVGIKGTNSAIAYSWRGWGQTLNKPAYGSVAIMNYSHVGFVAGVNKDGRIVLLGGNQGKPGAVNLSANPVSAVISYQYPLGYKPSYKLPLYNLSSKSLDFKSTR